MLDVGRFGPNQGNSVSLFFLLFLHVNQFSWIIALVVSILVSIVSVFGLFGIVVGLYASSSRDESGYAQQTGIRALDSFLGLGEGVVVTNYTTL